MQNILFCVAPIRRKRGFALVELDSNELIRTRIQKARFADKTMNELATQDPLSQADILKQIDVLCANADQSPWDAVKAMWLLEFIDNTLPKILNPPSLPDEEEQRIDRHAGKMQHDDPHLDLKALRRIQST